MIIATWLIQQNSVTLISFIMPRFRYYTKIRTSIICTEASQIEVVLKSPPYASAPAKDTIRNLDIAINQRNQGYIRRNNRQRKYALVQKKTRRKSFLLKVSAHRRRCTNRFLVYSVRTAFCNMTVEIGIPIAVG